MERSQTVAVIDVGSNSIKLLVGRAQGKSVETVYANTVETRISEGISAEWPELQDESMASGVATIFELYNEALGYAPTSIQIVATSAVRDAVNGGDFAMMVLAATGVEMRILSGDEEANYIGRGIACDPAIAGVGSFIQMDIGGGSLELIRFDAGKIENAISLQLGAVRLTERFIQQRAQPILTETAAEIKEHVVTILKASGFDFTPETLPMVATGGAFVIARSLLAARAGVEMQNYSAVLSVDDLTTLEKELSPLPLVERMQIPHLPAPRADIVPTALITILALLDFAGRDRVTHSLYNLRYGIAAEMLDS